ncbi:hypothetical protein TRFO_16877 [Tritrichomonas foetus]|uniref:Smr domain-containing protein n=1 Tax=Tritrichomonas foetus TaxID=1144522 RepID=A0A1J4KTX9_9EUKA|nr:hypothetical protein TRFO_16877 [Tritrichomonas foetus]|eukprot:OHT13118.1 hypothetical protein TRFO_16877 [Tritrichomonas foetus]
MRRRCVFNELDNQKLINDYLSNDTLKKCLDDDLFSPDILNQKPDSSENNSQNERNHQKEIDEEKSHDQILLDDGQQKPFDKKNMDRKLKALSFKNNDLQLLYHNTLRSCINRDTLKINALNHDTRALHLPKRKQYEIFIDVHGFRVWGATLLYRRIYLLMSSKKTSKIRWCIGKGNHSSKLSPLKRNPLYEYLKKETDNLGDSKLVQLTDQTKNLGQCIATLNPQYKHSKTIRYTLLRRMHSRSTKNSMKYITYYASF